MFSSWVTNPPDFSQLSYEDAGRALNKEVRKKIAPEYVTNLVNQLRKRDLASDKKVFVICLLGELRPTDKNSMEALIDDVAFVPPQADDHTWKRWGSFPSAKALTDIGMPAVDPILNHLSVETNALRRQLMCDVLIRVEGKSGVHYNEEEGKKIMQGQVNERLIHESIPARQSNLKASLRELENWDSQKLYRNYQPVLPK
jgi:hypothetical protein